MPKKSKTLCVDDLRHAEYYGMQDTFDELYQKSQNGEVFENLMDLILSRDNILLAYRNIKANKGSYTAGTDKKNITDIGSRTPDDVVKRVRFIVTGSEHGYRPKPVRRKDIPKPNGKTVVVKHFCNTLFENSPGISSFKWCFPIIVGMRTDMIVPYVHISV